LLRITNCVMKGTILVTICIALLCAGCLEHKDSVDRSGTKAMSEGKEKLTITGSTTILPLGEAAAEGFQYPAE